MNYCRCKKDLIVDNKIFAKDVKYNYDYIITNEDDILKKIYLVLNINGEKIYCDKEYFNNNFEIIK